MAPRADRCQPSEVNDFRGQPLSFGVTSSAETLLAERDIANLELQETHDICAHDSPSTTAPGFTCTEALTDACHAVKPVRTTPVQPQVELRGWKRGLVAVEAVLNKLDIISSMTEEVSLIARLVRTEKIFVVSFVNQHVMNQAWRSPDFASCLLESDVLLRDGIGVEVCLAILGKRVGLNMNGTDFIPRLAAAFAGRRTVIFGTTEPWTGAAAAALASLGCRVVGTMDGFRPEPAYVAEVARTAPELVILAMGNPKQEAVAKAIASAAASPMVIVNGGAIADFLSHRFERAPLWLRSAHCEWLFRILQEPRRLWRRYLLGGVSFARCVMLLRLASR